MTIGVGGSTAEVELVKLSNMAIDAKPITLAEYQQRIEKAKTLMRENNIDAIYLNAGTNLYYFTGTRWYPSERLVGALLTQDGKLEYLSPNFEIV